MRDIHFTPIRNSLLACHPSLKALDVSDEQQRFRNAQFKFDLVDAPDMPLFHNIAAVRNI